MAEKQKKFDDCGVVLRAYRLEKGFTQEQLSERVGVVHSFIHSLESGKKQPSMQMILKLATALGIRSGDLMNAVEDRIARR